MTRTEIIERLSNTSEAYCSRIADRLNSCNVRVVRTNGTRDGNAAIRCRLQALHAMLDDETIAGVEYRFNNRWESV
jgi:hypothetical protein